MSRLARRSAAPSTLLVALLFASTAAAQRYCPSFTPAQTRDGRSCAIEPVGGTNPTVAQWRALMAAVATNPASAGVRAPALRVGCGQPRAPGSEPAAVPCPVLQAIAMQESGWRQFCVPTTPAGSVGAPQRTLVTEDCGYGVAQVTSGMRVGETAAFDRSRVAADAAYNLAVGARILTEKWNAAGCVADGDPSLVEDWYLALWAYNGLSYANHPANPKHTASRGPYNPRRGGAYAYQERVLGWMEHPPSGEHWQALAPAYPALDSFEGTRAPRALPAPACESPTSCATGRPRHRAPCDGDAGPLPPEPSVPPAGPAPRGATDGAAPVAEEWDAGVAGGGPATGAAPLEAAPPELPEEGCGCRAAPGAGSPGAKPGAGLFAVALAAALRRRQRGNRAKYATTPSAARATTTMS